MTSASPLFLCKLAFIPPIHGIKAQAAISRSLFLLQWTRAFFIHLSCQKSLAIGKLRSLARVEGSGLDVAHAPLMPLPHYCCLSLGSGGTDLHNVAFLPYNHLWVAASCYRGFGHFGQFHGSGFPKASHITMQCRAHSVRIQAKDS